MPSWPTATIGVVFWISGLSAIMTGIMWIAISFSMRGAVDRLATDPAF